VVEDASAATSLNQLRSLVTELFRALDETLRENREGAEERLQRIAGLIGDVDAQPQTTPTKIPQGGLAPWQLRRVLSHIEANLDTTIRNTDLALLVHLSPFYFNVAFRRSTGNSPREYIIRRRIERIGNAPPQSEGDGDESELLQQHSLYRPCLPGPPETQRIT